MPMVIFPPGKVMTPGPQPSLTAAPVKHDEGFVAVQSSFPVVAAARICSKKALLFAKGTKEMPSEVKGRTGIGCTNLNMLGARPMKFVWPKVAPACGGGAQIDAGTPSAPVVTIVLTGRNWQFRSLLRAESFASRMKGIAETCEHPAPSK